MKSTILITSHKRAHLLKYGLQSLARQQVPNGHEVEYVVLNDGVEDDTEQVCDSFKDQLNIKYFFTGKDKKNEWRVPGYAINYGAKQTDSDFLFISCAEIYHLDQTLPKMINALVENRKKLTIPHGCDDDGSILKEVIAGNNIKPDHYDRMIPLYNVHLPFFMGMSRVDFMDIGGYDEEFTGCGYDDNDIVDRMVACGNKHFKVQARIVHLWHQRLNFQSSEVDTRFKFNERLYHRKRGQVKRNIDKNWGNL